VRTTTVIVAVAGILLLAGCGQGSNEPSTSGTTQPVSPEEGTMRLTSPAFEDQAKIPAEYTCDGEDVSPPLVITDIPQGTETLALIVEDPDSPGGTWDHWVVFDIPPTDQIPRGATGLGTDGVNTFGATGYGGPCPPSGSHRYLHRVFALDIGLGLTEGATKTEVLEAMKGHVVAEAGLVGIYR
jgi:Raf kinase inhibitor-like YbhB/YbcL family protein